MSHRGKQPRMHEDGVKESVAIHGFDHGIFDPADPLFVGCVGTFFHYCRIVAITHSLQLILIEKRAEIHVAIAVERFSLGAR